MTILDRYDQWVSDTTVAVFGMHAVPVAVAIYAGLPYLAGRLLGVPRLGALASVGMSVRMLVKQEQLAQQSPFPAP